MRFGEKSCILCFSECLKSQGTLSCSVSTKRHFQLVTHFVAFVLFVQQLLDDYPKCFIVGADNVGSKQMQQIRMSLRGKAVVLMGKNTMMRKAIRGHLENNPALEK